LADLTPSKVQQWKLSFVANAGNDPVKQRAARISANSFLRRAKSLFAPSMIKHLERVALPTPPPFDGVEFYSRTSMRYHSNFDVLKLIRTAKKELARSKPEQYKVFLLAVMAGLRRREIGTLEWSVGDSESKPAILTAGKSAGRREPM
jgi:integrase